MIPFIIVFFNASRFYHHKPITEFNIYCNKIGDGLLRKVKHSVFYKNSCLNHALYLCFLTTIACSQTSLQYTVTIYWHYRLIGGERPSPLFFQVPKENTKIKLTFTKSCHPQSSSWTHILLMGRRKLACQILYELVA